MNLCVLMCSSLMDHDWDQFSLRVSHVIWCWLFYSILLYCIM